MKPKAQVWHCLLATLIFGCGIAAPDKDDEGTGGNAYVRRLCFLPNTMIRVTQGTDRPNTSEYSHRIGSTLSQAVDFSLPAEHWGPCGDRGLPITAADQGVVIEIIMGLPDSPSSGFGNMVKILYNDGRVGRYAHLREIFVRKGEFIKQGQVIGLLGNSGNSTSCHLHYDEILLGSSQTLPLNFFEAGGIPQEGRTYSSRNTGPYDQIYWEHGGPTMLGEPSEEAGWFSSYVQCVDNDGDASFVCDNESEHRKNVHVLYLSGGLVNRGAIIYDALRGARSAVIIHGQMYDWWMANSGPRSRLGVPLTMEYIDSSGLTRQDGEGGYLTWDGREVSFHSWRDNVSPGEFDTSQRWDNAISYLFVETYKELGYAAVAGEPVEQFGNPAYVHLWSGTRYFIQDYNYSALGWQVIFYDPLNAGYGGKNQAIAIPPEFWNYYRAHDGVSNFGAPIAQVYTDSRIGLKRMDWESGFCLVLKRGEIIQGVQNLPPDPDYTPNSGQCVLDTEPDPDPDIEPEPDPDFDYDGDGYTALDGDCDIYNADINPDMDEICDDDWDNDCDGNYDCLDTECASRSVCEEPVPPETHNNIMAIRFTAPSGFSGEIIYEDWSGQSGGGTYRAPWAERCRVSSGSMLECELEQASGTFVVFNISYGTSWSCSLWPAVLTGSIEITWNGAAYHPVPESNDRGGCNYRVTFP